MNIDYLISVTPYLLLARRLPEVISTGKVSIVSEQLEDGSSIIIGAWVDVTTSDTVTGRDSKGPQNKPTTLYFSGREAREGKLDNELWNEI